MANRRTTVALTSLLWMVSAPGAGASPAASDSPPIIVVRGVLESRKVAGPKEGGETPKNAGKVVIYQLKLPMPVPAGGLGLPDDPGAPGKGFQEVQLLCDYPGYPECEAMLKKSDHHPVRVVGQTARSAEQAGQLPIVMHVRLITVVQ